MPASSRIKSARRGYATLRLNTASATAWAVIVLGTGAIATDASNQLLMRLSQAEASRIAAELTEAASLKNDDELTG